MTTANLRQNQTTVSEILTAVKHFKGITRKSSLGELLPILEENVYDDAGTLHIDNINAVVSADGIVEGLVRDDPWLAGFYSVVVNVNDVVAKGARPLGFAHIVSSSSASVRRQIVQGVKHGLEKYGLKFLKAHTHPDTSYDAIDGFVVGIAKNFLSSNEARPNDSLVVAIDLDGKPGLRSWVKTFDSVLLKTRKQVLTRLEAIIRVAEGKLAHACRDISGPGVIGTIGMLCESSHVGASIIAENIPKPRGTSMLEWLLTYPSTGFVLATGKPKECMEHLTRHQLTAEVVGRLSKKKTVLISYEGQKGAFVDLAEESLFGLQKKGLLSPEHERMEVKELAERDAFETELLLRKVWSAAYEYPEEWRRRRLLTSEQISTEMRKGYHYFGVRVNNQLVGVYKTLVTENGLLGEHQSVDPDFRGLGLATAMYRQFIKFAKTSCCRKAYVNTLANQAASRKILEKMGFRKKGREFEQAKGMAVQLYEKLL